MGYRFAWWTDENTDCPNHDDDNSEIREPGRGQQRIAGKCSQTIHNQSKPRCKGLDARWPIDGNRNKADCAAGNNWIILPDKVMR